MHVAVYEPWHEKLAFSADGLRCLVLFPQIRSRLHNTAILDRDIHMFA